MQFVTEHSTVAPTKCICFGHGKIKYMRNNIYLIHTEKLLLEVLLFVSLIGRKMYIHSRLLALKCEIKLVCMK